MTDLARALRAPQLDLPVAGGKGEPVIQWSLDQNGASEVLTARVPLRHLERNVQAPVPSAPMYAFATAFWAHTALQRPINCRIELEADGAEAASGPRAQHRRRALFLYGEMARLFAGPSTSRPTTLELITPEQWAWPSDPWLTKESVRGDPKENEARERRFELSLCCGPDSERAARELAPLAVTSSEVVYGPPAKN